MRSARVFGCRFRTVMSQVRSRFNFFTASGTQREEGSFARSVTCVAVFLPPHPAGLQVFGGGFWPTHRFGAVIGVMPRSAPLTPKPLCPPTTARTNNLNSEVEDLRFRANPCGAGFPACRFAALSSPALGRLESRPNWQTRMSAPLNRVYSAAGLTSELNNDEG